MNDPVNHPKHYTTGKIEVITVIEHWRACYHLGNVIKYIARHEYKGNPVEDLKKAEWYLERLCEFHKKFPEEILRSLSTEKASESFDEVMIDWKLPVDMVIVLKNIVEKQFKNAIVALSNYILKIEKNQTEQINE